MFEWLFKVHWGSQLHFISFASPLLFSFSGSQPMRRLLTTPARLEEAVELVSFYLATDQIGGWSAIFIFML